MITYHAVPGVEPITAQDLLLLSTQPGGRVVVDRQLLALWREADGRELTEIIERFKASSLKPIHICAGLICLVEAGLLRREGFQPEPQAPQRTKNSLVSVVIVSHNSQSWLERCLPSLFSQTHPALEIIIVDNGSRDGSSEWLVENYPDLRLILLEQPHSLAYALNQGIASATGKFYLLINPDVELDQNALAHLVSVAQGDSACAAVAAKLKFIWAPAFLNGLGNYVGALSWGTDSALGHLDLGQFDMWDEIPSACFAAALIPASIWNKVGPIDEGFPLYYEDSEWCYRARLKGFSIRAAPQAIVYHAFSGRVPTGKESGLITTKLRQVVYGRLRFAIKILSLKYLVRFMLGYIIEDLIKFSLALLRGHWRTLQAYLQAWTDYYNSLQTLRSERKSTQALRQRPDKDLFDLQREIPAPLIRNGLPQLTWDIVCHQYFPLLISGKTRPFPEFTEYSEGELTGQSAACKQSLFKRAISIWRSEGLGALLHRMGRGIQWRLMQP